MNVSTKTNKKTPRRCTIKCALIGVKVNTLHLGLQNEEKIRMEHDNMKPSLNKIIHEQINLTEPVRQTVTLSNTKYLYRLPR